MTKKTRERLALWVGQAIAVSVTIASIWFAANLGYQQAVRYARYESMRRTRNLLRAVEHELALNERAVRAALEDWDTDAFRHVHVLTRSFERAKQTDEWFLLNPEAVKAISDSYDEELQKAIDGIRQYRMAPVIRLYAATLTDRLALMAEARPLIEKEIDAIEGRMREYGVPEESLPKTFPAETASINSEELAAAEIPATPGWKRAEPSRYEKKLVELHRGHLGVVALPRGPNLIHFRLRQGFDDRPIQKLWLVLVPRSPVLKTMLRPGLEDEALRKILSLEVPGAIVLAVPLPENAQEVEVLDPNRPAPWRYAFAIAENDQGERSFLRRLEVSKAGKDAPARLSRKPTPGALVVPRDYR